MRKLTKKALLERWKKEKAMWADDEKRAQQIKDIPLEDRCRARVLIYESCIRDLEEML